MTLLLGVVAFGFATCAYVLHEVRKAPFGIEVGGRFFISENRAPSTTFDSAAAAPVAAANLVPTQA